MRNVSFCRFGTIAGAVAILIGCGSGGRPRYSAAVKNETGEKIEVVDLLFGEFKCAPGGYLAPNGFAFDVDVPCPVPEKARIDWKTIDGKAHTQEVEVLPLMPKAMDHVTIFFVIRNDGSVGVTPLTREERLAGKPPYGPGKGNVPK